MPSIYYFCHEYLKYKLRLPMINLIVLLTARLRLQSWHLHRFDG